jgi:hypothetical protein
MIPFEHNTTGTVKLTVPEILLLFFFVSPYGRTLLNFEVISSPLDCPSLTLRLFSIKPSRRTLFNFGKPS